MDFSDISLSVLTIVSLLAAALLAIALWRLSGQRNRLSLILKPEAGEPLERAAARLYEEAELCGQVPELKSSFDQLMANSPVPAIIVDENQVITGLSHQAEMELDQPRIRRGLLEGLESAELEAAARQALQSMKSGEIDVRLYASGRRTYHAKLLPFQFEGGRRCLIFLQSAAATVEFGELRSQFAATVSHELRTPLAGIRALVETLKEPGIKDEDRERFIERIEHETNRLGQLVDEILFLSSLESGAASLVGSAELGEVAGALAEKFAPLAEKFEVRIENDVPAGLAVALPERMAHTVLSNLLENAIKYGGRGSRVAASAAREGNSVRLTVKDDGIGIDAEHLPHIFERFYRVDKSRSRRLGGTGLGLSIVKHIVESAGGEVRVKSQEGFGTEFTVLLPAAG